MVSKNQALSGRQADLISWKRAGKWNVDLNLMEDYQELRDTYLSFPKDFSAGNTRTQKAGSFGGRESRFKPSNLSN